MIFQIGFLMRCKIRETRVDKKKSGYILKFYNADNKVDAQLYKAMKDT